MGKPQSWRALMKTSPCVLAPPGSIEVGAVIELDPAEGRHLTGSLRLRDGDEVVLADGRGLTAAARLTVIGKARVEAEVMSVHVEPEPPGDGITLALAVIEAKAMDWAVQKSVEIGIRRFQPIVTERTQAGGRVTASRSSHWRRIALQALKQCRRAWAMDILEVQTLARFVESQGCGGVVADPNGLTIGRLTVPQRRVLAVGPEGGFSAAEHDLFTRNGWARLRLGDNILRSETAAVVGGAMMLAWDTDGALVDQG